jgi:hypothetical protein
MKSLGIFTLFIALISHAALAGPIPGVDGPFVSVHNGKIVVTLKMQEAVHPTGFSFAVTEEKKSTVTYMPNVEEGGMMVELRLDLDDLKSMPIPEGESSTLADGRAIPGVPGGALKNSTRIDRGNGFSTFHSPKSFGVAIPFQWNLGSTRDGHHWLNWKGKNIGMISVVNASQDKKAFGMIFLRYSALRGNKELMNYLNRSKKSTY